MDHSIKMCGPSMAPHWKLMFLVYEQNVPVFTRALNQNKRYHTHIQCTEITKNKKHSLTFKMDEYVFPFWYLKHHDCHW